MSEISNEAKEVNAALRRNDLDRVSFLLAQNPNLIQEKTSFGNWIHLAIRFRYFYALEFLANSGVDAAELDGSGRSTLSLAARTGEYEAVVMLYSLGAPIDIESALRNPLFGAIDSKNLEIVKFLVGHGIDVFKEYTLGKGKRAVTMNALAYAEEQGADEIADYLRMRMASQK